MRAAGSFNVSSTRRWSLFSLSSSCMAALRFESSSGASSSFDVALSLSIVVFLSYNSAAEHCSLSLPHRLSFPPVSRHRVRQRTSRSHPSSLDLNQSYHTPNHSTLTSNLHSSVVHGRKTREETTSQCCFPSTRTRGGHDVFKRTERNKEHSPGMITSRQNLSNLSERRLPTSLILLLDDEDFDSRLQETRRRRMGDRVATVRLLGRRQTWRGELDAVWDSHFG